MPLNTLIVFNQFVEFSKNDFILKKFVNFDTSQYVGHFPKRH